MNYTKGKWEVANESYTGDLFIKTAEGKYIALANMVDAQLIAAAPDMYEALKAIRAGKGEISDNAWLKTISALSKAEGKS